MVRAPNNAMHRQNAIRGSTVASLTFTHSENVDCIQATTGIPFHKEVMQYHGTSYRIERL